MTDVRLVAEVPDDADAVACWAFAGEEPIEGQGFLGFLAASGFTGQLGQTAMLPDPDGGDRVRLMIGFGPRPSRVSGISEVSGISGVSGVSGQNAPPSATLRRAGATLARAARRYRRVAATVPVAGAGTARAMVEGFLLGSYRFDRYRSAPRSAPDRPVTERLDIVTTAPAAPGAEAEVSAALRVAAAVATARDLGNEPGGSLTPTVFADRAADMARARGLGCDVWDEHRISAERLGGLLGVSRGSAEPPRLVRLDYRPPGDAAATVALVGKGVTFDAGGLSLKPTKQLVDMKIDMAGAAAVLGAMSALLALGCPVRVVGWLPLTENMPDGAATRLGDVLRTRNGTTVEVRNADAEGRLILADALALAGEERPDAIVDVATLTAAVSMAVGRRYAGLAGNHDGWLDQVRAAAARAGEPVWTLPLDDADPGRRLRSTIADLANVPASADGQSVAAALFLREFVPPGTPWAHLDINGPAFTDEDDGDLTPGATGYGVRTLIELLNGVSARPYT
jgi:leucyl aminopeptidase